MRHRSFFGPYWVIAAVLCFTTGCPQMLEDDFAMARPEGFGGSALSGGTAGTSEAGVGGAGSCDGSGQGCAQGGSAGAARDSGSGVGPDAECGSSGVRGPNGDCYASGSTEKSWTAARESCQARGTNWDLATIRGAEENDFVLSITGFEAWIGATDETNEGTWLWVRDDDPFFDVDGVVTGALPYTNWNQDEPNDADDSDCLRILTTGLWADWNCRSVKGYVCQETAP